MWYTNISRISLTLCIIGGFFVFSYIWSGILYAEYSKLWDYRRLHPEFLPDTKVISLLDAGHHTTYADILWINLVQYIGDNIGNGKFNDYAPPLLSRITEMHPYFTRAYILWLLLSPSLDPDKVGYEKNRLLAEKSLNLGLKGIEKTCNPNKLDIIRKREINTSLWNEKTLQNPCNDGMLPYYIAYIASNLWNTQEAEEYYKIASMNTDAPKASQFLSVLMRAKSGNLVDAAKKFLLIAIDGYDEDPYVCRINALEILKKIGNESIITLEKVKWIEKKEKEIQPPKDIHNPLSASATNCHDSTKRWIKQLYLAYIENASLSFPEVTTGDELIAKKIIPYIPKLEEQKTVWKNWTVRKWSGSIWVYKEVFKD